MAEVLRRTQQMLTRLKKKMTHKKGKGKYLFFSGSEENYVRNGAWLVEESIALFHGKANPIRHLSVDDLNNMNVEQFPRVRERYCEIYNGCWEGRVVRVKKACDKFQHAPEHCLREIVVATQMATHSNAHKILGCCLETNSPVLVYEWKPPETLHDHIFLDDENKSKAILEWKDRLRIAWEISHVVAYLHNAFPRPIIHRDLAPANVFLDQDNATKLGAFGLSISIPEGEEFVEDIPIRGTFDYMAPEYSMIGIVSEKSDVYSFGMLFLELLTGKRPSFFESGFDMITFVKNCIKNNCFHEIVDPTIIGNGVTSIEDLQLRASAQLALRCAHYNRVELRPTMVEVATELKNMIRSLEGGGIYRYFLGSKENFIQNKALVSEESLSLFHGKVDPIRYFSADELNKMNVEFWPNNCNWYQGSWERRAVLVKLPESVIESVYESCFCYVDLEQIPLRLSREIVVATLMSTHNNVHKLLGCCLETKIPVLIYEWVAAETLEDRILLKHNNQNRQPLLEWKDRLRIAWEISNILSYFHSAFPRPIIHGYLEPRNVFLNQDNTAILSNFGLSVSIPEGQNFVVDHSEKGTVNWNHWGPECQIHRNFSEYTDVYSFGVLFIVLLTGKDATFSSTCIGENAKSTNIIDWVTEKIRNKRISEIVDPVINNSEVPASDLSASIDLALRCTSIQAYTRPTMEDVEIELRNMLRSSKSIPTTSSVV